MKTMMLTLSMALAACGGSDGGGEATQTDAGSPVAICNICRLVVGGWNFDDPKSCIIIDGCCTSCEMDANNAVVQFNGRTGPGEIIPGWSDTGTKFTAYTGIATQLSPSTFSIAWSAADGTPQTAQQMLSSDWIIGTKAILP